MERRNKTCRREYVVIGIDVDDIVNLEDLLRVVFINEECENPKVVVERLVEILTKRRSQTFYRDMDLNSVTNSVDGVVSSISKWDIVNQFGKHDFPCG